MIVCFSYKNFVKEYIILLGHILNASSDRLLCSTNGKSLQAMFFLAIFFTLFLRGKKIMQRVTPWNVGKLREAIVNGPDIHPGATHYIDRSATVKLPPSRKSRIATSRKLPSSRGVVVQNGKTVDNEPEGKVVLRHLQDGDIVLVNRQV